jgi:hypothetical protein
MISGLIGLLLLLLVLLVVWYIIKLAADYFGAPPVFLQILGLIFLLILVLSALQGLGAVPHWPWLR